MFHTQIPRLLAVLALAGFIVTPGAVAAWTLEKLASPPEALPASSPPAKSNALPDGGLAEASSGDLVAAWYEDPTRRYGHAVLGDSIEAGSLAAQTADGVILRLVLPGREVFEDITPRLADLDGDGRTEIITIRSSVTAGAAVTVYGLRGATLQEVATTPFIGHSHRWLNVAALAPIIDPDRLAIAYVETPHIGGTLRIYHLKDSALIEKAQLFGFSNHAIGSRELALSVTFDADGDELADLLLPDAARSALRLIGWTKNDLIEKARYPMPARVSGPLTMTSNGSEISVIVPLDDGKTYRLGIQPQDLR